MAKSTFREDVAAEMLRQIAAGTAPWQKPWDSGLVRMAPFNPGTGTVYKGINAFWLEMKGHEDPRWLTYRQARELGAQVRKGERGRAIEYWKWSDRVKITDDNGKPVLDGEGQQQYRSVRLDRPQVFQATVFNAGQIDGLAPLHQPEMQFEPVTRAEEILAGADVIIKHDQGDRAFYSPLKDEIHLPPQEAFDEAYKYYATALHEVGHSTGHVSRLDREYGPFGSETYAIEELRAEMAAYMLATELGLGHYPERHANYVEGWASVLKKDRNAIFRAARDADRIRSWIMEPELRPEMAKQAQLKKEGVAMTASQNKSKIQTSDQNLSTPSTGMSADQLPQPESTIGASGKVARHYLNVPFAEKDEARALGAKWHRKQKSWYVLEGADMTLFQKWQNKNAGPDKMSSLAAAPETEFAVALKDNGLLLKGAPVMDGEWHRIPVEGDRKGQASGSYRGFLDGLPNGQIMNYKMSTQAVKWIATGNREMSRDEMTQYSQDAALRQRERNEQRLATEKQVSKKAYAIWMSDKNKPTDNHPYLAKKQIMAPQLKVNEKNQLLVAMKDEKGFIWSLQTITPEGDKYFLKDGRKKGLMAVVGDEKTLTEDKQQVIVCEGFATAKSLHDATGLTVVAAFDKGNLKPVIKALQTQNSNLAFIVAGDNDHKLESNPALQKNVGALAAKEAAEICQGKDIIPVLTDKEKEHGLSDFNDLAVSRGIGEVNKQLKPLISQKTRAQKKDQGQGMIIGM